MLVYFSLQLMPSRFCLLTAFVRDILPGTYSVLTNINDLVGLNIQDHLLCSQKCSNKM
jgi:hypothetical protein